MIFRILLLASFGLLLGAPSGFSQNIGLPNPDLVNTNNELLIKGDRQEFDQARDMIIVTGNAVVEFNGQIVTADTIALDRDKMKAFASGNVKISQPSGQTWTFPEFEYDFNAGADQMPGQVGAVATPDNPNWRGQPGARTPDALLYYPPFTVFSEEAQYIGKGHIYLKKVMITTCQVDPFSIEKPEYYILADDADVYDEEIVVLTNARFWFNGVRIWAQKKYTLDTKREATNYDVLPGYSSRDGAFILNAYTWYPSENWNTTSHLDYRSDRGLAFGQDLEWYDNITKDEKEAAAAQVPFGEFDRGYQEPEELYRGKVTGYFSADDAPYRSEAQEARERARGIDIDDQRYRFRAAHNQSLTENDLLYLEANVWSDEEVTKDFFNREFRTMPVPENRINLVHYNEQYTLGLEVNRQINPDDFSNVNRVPEVTLAAFQKPVFDTGLYYDTFNSASLLESTFNKELRDVGFQDYESERVHTSHALSYPMKYFGFLNVIPRVTWYGTYYGDTAEIRQEDVVDENTGDTNAVDRIVTLGADFRNMAQFDLQNSFKAFRVLHENWRNEDSKGLRHVVEPYGTYTFINEPDLRPVNIFQFDFLDTFDRRNDVIFGLRNKLQTKRMIPGLQNSDGSPVVFVQDIVDVNVFATYLLDPEDEDTEQFSSLFVDTEFRAGDWLQLDSRIEYDHNEGELARSENSAQFISEEYSFVGLSHVYRPDVYNTAQISYGLWPQRKVSLFGFTRYAFEEGILEEQGVVATYKTDCVGYGIGGNFLAGDLISDTEGTDEEEWKVYFQVWILAFPGSSIDLGL